MDGWGGAAIRRERTEQARRVATNVYCGHSLVKCQSVPQRYLFCARSVIYPSTALDATSPDDDVSRNAVLIFSSDPLAAALLAAAIEFAGHAPHFARQAEAARGALRRVRPRLVLIDCDHDESCSEEFIGPAIMMKAEVLLFRSDHTLRDVHELVERMTLKVIDLSDDKGLLVESLR